MTHCPSPHRLCQQLFNEGCRSRAKLGQQQLRTCCEAGTCPIFTYNAAHTSKPLHIYSDSLVALHFAADSWSLVDVLGSGCLAVVLYFPTYTNWPAYTSTVTFKFLTFQYTLFIDVRKQPKLLFAFQPQALPCRSSFRALCGREKSAFQMLID